MALCRHYAYTCKMGIRTASRGNVLAVVRGAVSVAVSLLAGAAVTALSWPAWHEIAPVVPVIDRVLRVAISVAPGIVVTAIGLELLAGLRLVSWFATWTNNLVIKGRAKSPIAAWRELQARDDASRRWHERHLRPRTNVQTGQIDRSDVRLYADVERDHHEHGDEDPPLYNARKSAANPAKPFEAPHASPKGSLSPDARHAFWRVFGRPPSEPSPPGAPRPDGIVLDPQDSEAVQRDVFGGPTKPK